jgi:hypothetical protein
MMRGCVPFSSPTNENLLYKIISDNYVPIEKNRNYTDELINLIHTMLDKVLIVFIKIIWH